MSIKSTFEEIKSKSYAYMFLLPMLLGMFIIHFIPMIIGIIMSFLDLNQYTLAKYLSAPFVGLNNYFDVLFNPNGTIRIGLLQSVRNTIVYTIGAVSYT
ncbi:MAG: sugar ABC transporter permease, partial [Endomicrobia bacterium]|nr:sugar ABC transporter permease [Endomicrobiia bacterium]